MLLSVQTGGAGLEAVLRLAKLNAILLFCLCSIPRVQAGATLFLGEPYGYDGALAGTGHAAVYLSHVCATSPVILRLCGPGETGIVLSRYRGIGGYDWIAIPRIPYLYAVEKPEDVPLFADKKLVAFLRDRYRRDHLELLVPDLPGGGTPDGDWYELIGASYLRTIYASEIETSPEQDAKLILHAQRPVQPPALEPNYGELCRLRASDHQFLLSTLGASQHHRRLGCHHAETAGKNAFQVQLPHPELQTSRFVIPQVPGTIARSKRVKGVLEVMLTSKKYMPPIFLFHPYAAGIAVAVYVQHWHFNPGKNALILDSKHQLGAPLTSADRRAVHDQLEELIRAATSTDAGADERQWTSSYAAAEPALDAAGGPTLQVREGGEVTSVGIARSNILNDPTDSEFAAGLVKARLREELKSSAAQKTARADVESDMVLLQQLLLPQPKGSASTASFATESRPLSSEDVH